MCKREGKPQRKARGKPHGAVHVEASSLSRRGPPFVRRHAERAHRDRPAALASKTADRIARFHAFVPSPFTRRRDRNKTNGRFCIRQVSKASEIVPISSLRSST